MYGAWPEAYINLIYACGKLFGRADGKGTVFGEGAGVIVHEGAAAMANALVPHTCI